MPEYFHGGVTGLEPGGLTRQERRRILHRWQKADDRRDRGTLSLSPPAPVSAIG